MSRLGQRGGPWRDLGKGAVHAVVAVGGDTEIHRQTLGQRRERHAQSLVLALVPGSADAEFADLIALVALYRPGPMAFISTYARNKRSITLNLRVPEGQELVRLLARHPHVGWAGVSGTSWRRLR